ERHRHTAAIHSFPTRRSSDLHEHQPFEEMNVLLILEQRAVQRRDDGLAVLGTQRLGRDVFGEEELQPVEKLAGGRLLLQPGNLRSEEHTSELQSLAYLVCRLL